MSRGRKKTVDQVRGLLKKDDEGQMSLFVTSDQPLRDAIFAENRESEDNQPQSRRKLFDNDEK